MRRRGVRRVRVRRVPSRTATRIAFAVIVAFLLTQVVWWLVFQEGYIGEVSRVRVASWERDAATANLMLDRVGMEMIDDLIERYPQLRFDQAASQFVVDERVRTDFERQQRGYLRMFAFEGPFFALVILSLLVFIALSLRTERDLKRRQQNFLSAVTHEFKTPLSTLRLLVQTARWRQLSPEKLDDYLAHMEGELDRLERTSDQVLASARLEQAVQAPVLKAVDLNRVVEEFVVSARAGLEARGARLSFTAGPEPLPVSIDEAAFGVVVNNLLDNAVKYSHGPEKPITITLELDHDLVRLHVDDRGVGLEEGEAERIFGRFYRAGDEMTRKAPGVGLGLHLVRSITEAMNGWVTAVPNPGGRGARFTVVLPRRLPVGGPGGPPSAPGAGMSRPAVLVVEDEATLAEVLSDNLEHEGYAVTVAHDGEDGYRLWSRGAPDLVVLDVMLPGMSGIALCRRRRDEGDHTPVLFLSARGRPEDRVEGLAAGGDDYLGKPFHLQEFLLRIKAMLRRRGWSEDADAGFAFGDHRVDYRSWTARLADGREALLGEREIGIFKLLATRAGEVVSRDDILDEVWGSDAFPASRTVDNFVLRLRRLFEPDPSSPIYFHTVWGVGYRFTPEGAEPQQGEKR